MNKNYWEQRYLSNETGWDIGYAAPALIEYCRQIHDKSIEILIPGCGYGHEVSELVKLGFKIITVIDLSDTALSALRTKIDESVNLVNGNFFDLEGEFDLVIEQTFFCALEPSLRNEYVKKMHALLKPGGKLMGVLFNREFDGGPPFGGSEQEYRKLFSPLFEIRILEPCYNSIQPRMGTELFMLMVRKA